MRPRQVARMGWLAWLLVGLVQASIIIPIQWVDGPDADKSFGDIKVDDTPYGLLLTPNLKGLSPGLHGFHVHTLPLCSGGGMAAGGHLDPRRTNLHQGPYRANGHLGDMPVLLVDEKGIAVQPVLAPRLTLKMIRGHSLMIHAGGDDYSENALKQPGSATRVACGVIPSNG